VILSKASLTEAADDGSKNEDPCVNKRESARILFSWMFPDEKSARFYSQS